MTVDAAFTLDDRYTREHGTVYLTGVHALVRVVLDRVRHDRALGRATAAFVSGYEGSPLAGFDLELARRHALLAEHDVVHQPGLNEELGATSVMGSQLAGRLGTRKWDGVTGYWYGKAPGLDRATDALRHANLAGTHPRGGAVAFVGDDPGAKSSTIPAASELALADLWIPVFAPTDPQDLLEQGLHAVELSRASGLWTAMKIVTNLADSAGTATVPHDWLPPRLAGNAYSHQPNARLLGAQLAALEHSLYTVRLPIALDYIRASGLNKISGATDGARIGIIASGKSYLDVRQALSALGLTEPERFGIRVLKLGVIHPVDPDIVREFAAGLTEIVVLEEKRAFIETAVKNILYGLPDAPMVHGKRGLSGQPLFPETGDFNADTVAAKLTSRLVEYGVPVQQRGRRERIAVPLLTRTPYFCSGCPHNSSTKVPDKDTLVGGGIGCHTMALFMRPEEVGDVIGITQMGGEGAQWIGMAPFVEAPHFIQNLGDGTYTHSGSLAIRAAIASGVNVTFKLLHNSAVAMTGGQTAEGALPVEKIATALLTEGARKVVITSDNPARVRRLPLPQGVEVRDRGELISTQRELAKVPGVTVLIHDQECAAEKRRKRARGARPASPAQVMINERLCEGCGDCGGKSNCLSVQPVETQFGRKTRIHQSSCNADHTCLAGDCPSFMTIVPGTRETRQIPDISLTDLPEPERTDTDFTVRITGIGGTGVVTLAQVLATAAAIGGKHVRALDQTGLAQKGGAVVSDIRITARPTEATPNLGAGEADLYLGCDALVAADPAYLAATDPGRTTAVISTAKIPTSQMIVDTGVSYPDKAAIASAIDPSVERCVYVDARALAEDLFGDDLSANVLQLGVAYQAGTIGLSATLIELAIRLNGKAVDRNLQAFRRGRQAVADPDALRAAVAPDEPQWPTDLDGMIDFRAQDLVAYQNDKYAREYVDFVARIRAMEEETTDITEAVARNLYKLMAYKDEYEVARLALDYTADSGAKVSYRLHPPVLRAMGMRRKITFGPWIRPGFRVLRAMRRVRGTWLDPFGYARVRKIERELVEEYREVILQAMSSGGGDHATIVELAGLPDIIRGYENVKLGNVTEYHTRKKELIEKLSVYSTVMTAP
ncbi:indolepyruvate ferredoxin oxidoreductase family protein [Kibdelosporangium aridum]|uniref:indolepyruvate ferredoxin oxidoreductase family protein n=1 Tax=Kibdelosporangium aridum TaxID=2030 RepID=UPI00052485E8